MIQFENAISRYEELILKELGELGIYCWIAGGALRDYFAGVKIAADIDIFFPDQINYEKAETFFNVAGGEKIWESDNGCKFKYKNRKFDLVKKFFASPKATIDEFDFTVSMFAVDRNNVYFGETSFIDLAKRQLMINKITYPASTLSRAFRYHKKGYSICLGEMKKIILAIQDMPKEENNEAVTESDVPSGKNDLGTFFIGID